MEEGGGGVDDGDVDRAVAAFVGEDEGNAEEVADEPRDAAGCTQVQLAGAGRDEVRRRGGGGGEGVVEHGAEEGGFGGRGALDVGDDALGERGVAEGGGGDRGGGGRRARR